jgi:hypothetical protein
LLLYQRLKIGFATTTGGSLTLERNRMGFLIGRTKAWQKTLEGDKILPCHCSHESIIFEEGVDIEHSHEDG